MRKRRQPLVVQHLEGASRAALNRFPEVIRELARGRNGVYALYKGNRLYYVGLASNLRGRLHGHLADRHAGAWDRFSVYLTEGDEHLRELEALLLRIASPQGNKVYGKLSGSEDLRRRFRARIREVQRDEFNLLAGGFAAQAAREAARTATRKARKNRKAPIRGRDFDTLVCPAHVDGFQQAFIEQHAWWAVRLSPVLREKLKYVAPYVTKPVHAITHFGRIKSIEPYKRTGKYIIHLQGRPRRIGPIVHSPGMSMQGVRVALLAELRKAKQLRDVF